MENKKEIIESLSINERRVLPFLNEKSITKIAKASGLEEVAVMRALEYLNNKKIINLKISSTKVVELGVNGILYKQKGLPERRLLTAISDEKKISLSEAKKSSGLNDNEFQASLGALKKKALVNLAEGNLIFTGTREEISKKALEEQLLEVLPLEFDKLAPEQRFALEQLKNRKNIVEINNKTTVEFNITELGKEITKDSAKINQESKDYIEVITPEMISNGSWKGKKFRRYDITSPVPQVFGAKRHFVNQSIDYARKIWTEMGFKEMKSGLCQTGFWNFDALFTAQDHPVREIQDTFYLKEVLGNLPDKRFVEKIKEAHEKGVGGSKGWHYNWGEKDAKRVLLRTHTTSASAKTLSKLKKEDLPQKFFAIGRCFRNETVDWGHGFEFNQTEGIVVDKNANFRNLLGYLKQFYEKMGFKEIKFVPSYFPYTEPSVEIYVWNKDKNVWMEVGGAGMFRPEVVIPMLGEFVPVLAWGPGFDRSLMEYYGIKDLRELYKNNLEQLRDMKIWSK